MQAYNKPRVSIGMPVYNGARYITETFDSLLSQTFEDFELIICDNASTDQTEELCRTYAARDKRIQYVRNATNLGAAKNYGRTFELSCGEYFRWANADDLFYPESLARCVEVLDKEPDVVLTYPKTILINEIGEYIAEYEDGMHLQFPRARKRFVECFRRLGYVNVIYGLIRSKILRQTRLLRNFVGGDIPLVAELTLYGTFWEIPERLFLRRMHREAASSSTNIEQWQEFFDPRTKGQPPMREYKHLLTHASSIRRAPIPKVDKIYLLLYLVYIGIRIHKRLAVELFEATNYKIFHNFSHPLSK